MARATVYYRWGVGEMIQWVQHLPGEPQDQSFNPQYPHEAEYSGTLL